MNEITINISDYLSEDEMKEIAREKFGEIIERQFSDENQTERIISNTAYGMVFKRVDEVFGGKAELEKMILEKVIEQINKLSSFHIFRHEDVWGRATSPAEKIIHQAVADNAELISAGVSEALRTLPNKIVKEAIGDFIKNKLGAK